MMQVKTLIADDSALYRSRLKAALGKISQLEIVGSAVNGKQAIQLMQTQKVDLLILDIEMPEMNGIDTLKEIKRLGIKTKVILFSSHTRRGADITLEGLRLGASDFVLKPSIDSDLSGSQDPADLIHSLLEPKINGIFNLSNVPEAENKLNIITEPPRGIYPKVFFEIMKPSIVLIGASTGGPVVLEAIIQQLQRPLSVPVIIVQHMPPVFTASMASRLSKTCNVDAIEAKEGDLLTNDRIYIAPGDFHLSLASTSAGVKISLNQGPPINFVRPSIDPLFESASLIYGSQVLGFILTGMGSDGKAGAQKVKEKQGAIVVQDRDSAAVYGMPGAVLEAGAFDKVMSPDEIANCLNRKIGQYRRSKSQ